MGLLKSNRRKKAEKELEKRRGKSVTYTQPLVALTDEQTVDLETFLSEWYSRDIFDKAPDFPRLLEQYPETLGTHYALLVPHVVSFDEFWSRYFYRCSLTTILEEWSRQEADQKLLKDNISVSLPALKSRVLQKKVKKGSKVVDDGTIVVEGRENNRNVPKKCQKELKCEGEFETTIVFETGFAMDSDIVETIDEEDEREEAETVDLAFANFDIANF